jgi:hypothetical protein
MPLIKDLNGELFPFNWAKLLWRPCAKPRTGARASAADGCRKKFHGSRLASQLAFMLIEFTPRDAVGTYGIKTGEFGWILEDNKGMLSIPKLLPGARIKPPLPASTKRRTPDSPTHAFLLHGRRIRRAMRPRRHGRPLRDGEPRLPQSPGRSMPTICCSSTSWPATFGNASTRLR